MKISRFGRADLYNAIVLIAWAMALVWLLTGDRYLRFFEKDFQPLLMAALAVTVVFLVAGFLRPAGRKDSKSGVKIWLNTGLLLLPLLYIYGVPSAGLDNYARSRRVPYVESTLHDKGRPVSGEKDTAQPFDHNHDYPGFGDSVINVSLMDIETNIDSLIGKNIIVTGRLSHDAALPSGYFFIYRFVISCCAAHAMPMSLPVAGNPDMASIPEDNWIEIQGVVYPERMIIDSFVFDSIPVIHPISIRSIEPPASPYISSW